MPPPNYNPRQLAGKPPMAGAQTQNPAPGVPGLGPRPAQGQPQQKRKGPQPVMQQVAPYGGGGAGMSPLAALALMELAQRQQAQPPPMFPPVRRF